MESGAAQCPRLPAPAGTVIKYDPRCSSKSRRERLPDMGRCVSRGAAFHTLLHSKCRHMDASVPSPSTACCQQFALPNFPWKYLSGIIQRISPLTPLSLTGKWLFSSQNAFSFYLNFHDAYIHAVHTDHWPSGPQRPAHARAHARNIKDDQKTRPDTMSTKDNHLPLSSAVRASTCASSMAFAVLSSITSFSRSACVPEAKADIMPLRSSFSSSALSLHQERKHHGARAIVHYLEKGEEQQQQQLGLHLAHARDFDTRPQLPHPLDVKPWHGVPAPLRTVPT